MSAASSFLSLIPGIRAHFAHFDNYMGYPLDSLSNVVAVGKPVSGKLFSYNEKIPPEMYEELAQRFKENPLIFLKSVVYINQIQNVDDLQPLLFSDKELNDDTINHAMVLSPVKRDEKLICLECQISPDNLIQRGELTYNRDGNLHIQTSHALITKKNAMISAYQRKQEFRGYEYLFRSLDNRFKFTPQEGSKFTAFYDLTTSRKEVSNLIKTLETSRFSRLLTYISSVISHPKENEEERRNADVVINIHNHDYSYASLEDFKVQIENDSNKLYKIVQTQNDQDEESVIHYLLISFEGLYTFSLSTKTILFYPTNEDKENEDIKFRDAILLES